MAAAVTAGTQKAASVTAGTQSEEKLSLEYPRPGHLLRVPVSVRTTRCCIRHKFLNMLKGGH